VQTTTCCHFCGSCGQIVDEYMLSFLWILRANRG
jgi:hypothetical protein